MRETPSRAIASAPLRRLSVLLLLLLAAACGGDDGLGDGRHFAYVRSVDAAADPPTLALDTAEFLSGDEAARAAQADGAVDPGEAVPNDYYVRNPELTTVVVRVDAAVRVTRVACPSSCRDGVPGTFRGFAAAFSSAGPHTLADDYRGADSQYWVTLEGGRFVRIDEQYVP